MCEQSPRHAWRQRAGPTCLPKITCWVLFSPVFYDVALTWLPWLVAGLATESPERWVVPWDPSVRSRRKQVEIGSPGFWWTWRGLCCVCLHAQVHQQNAKLGRQELTLCSAATRSDPQLHLGLRDASVPALVSVPLLTDKATTVSCPLDHVGPPQLLGFWREGTGCKDPGRAAV